MKTYEEYSIDHQLIRARRLHKIAFDYLTTDELKEFDTSSFKIRECIVGLIYDLEYETARILEILQTTEEE